VSPYSAVVAVILHSVRFALQRCDYICCNRKQVDFTSVTSLLGSRQFAAFQVARLVAIIEL
jgi:hypothetical protein